jgi:hypothetical protein
LSGAAVVFLGGHSVGCGSLAFSALAVCPCSEEKERKEKKEDPSGRDFTVV